MAEIKQLFQVTTLPGIKRDGTILDGDNFSDGQWCRFQRGRPKKMGGFQQITDYLRGPVRDMVVWSRASMNSVFTFSTSKIETVLIDKDGLGSSILDRTPTTGFTANENIIWSTDTQYDDAVSSSGTVILAHASNSMLNIDDTTESKPFLGIASEDTVFTQITDCPPVSGGIFSVAPYTFVHGSDGFLAWSDTNQPQVWYTSAGNIGDAGADRITGAKIVKGLPLRSGSGVAGLLWSLDSVLRFDYTGGQEVFRFTHLSTQSSILAQNSVIEYDGVYFWIGIDRFMYCDGSKVDELPNQMNLNWFFDNLNYTQRQKVWAMKVPRYGEIWWFFPKGDATECTHAVIFNVREKTWYDTECHRSAGFYSQVFKYPVMSNADPSPYNRVLQLTSISGTISVGDTLRGVTSGVVGIVSFIYGSSYYVTLSESSLQYIAGEGVVDTTTSATATLSLTGDLYQTFLHEKGTDAVVGDSTTAIESYFTTADFGYPTGGAKQNDITGENRWTRLIRIEPDFLQSGTMDVTVMGKEFANASEVYSDPYYFESTTPKIDMREQRREIRLKFTSNQIGGHYEMGRIILHTELGDVRS